MAVWRQQEGAGVWYSDNWWVYMEEAWARHRSEVSLLRGCEKGGAVPAISSLTFGMLTEGVGLPLKPHC